MGKQATDPIRNRLHVYKEASGRPMKAGCEVRQGHIKLRDKGEENSAFTKNESNPYTHATQAVHYRLGTWKGVSGDKSNHTSMNKDNRLKNHLIS